MDRVRILVQGVVQGVGFRPFIHRLAHQWELGGFVCNTPQGAIIEVEGDRERIQLFIEQIQNQPPPGSRISSLVVTSVPPKGERRFTITRSLQRGEPIPSLMPDMATCHQCLKELEDPKDRRFRYPFINCVHCGPRFTIIERLPYDRENTTMKVFQMCPQCQEEYQDPASRRFHAQPNACPSCGPRIWLSSPKGENLAQEDQALKEAAMALKAGKILALKGLGGFHLMCRADRDSPIRLLRERKRRPEKPLAVMFPSIKALEESCSMSPQERRLLTSPQSPIVVLPTRSPRNLSPLVSPGLKTVGALLPYTPLHHLLLKETGIPLVATSGNASHEPLAITNQEALERLKDIADLFLLHDRPIKRPCDDSVVAQLDDYTLLMRRARGWAPLAIEVPVRFERPVLALGGHMKNTIALGVEDKVILTQHIGDLSHPLTQELLERTTEDLLGLLGVEPALVVIDKHPQYHSHRWGHRRFPGKILEVQHHFAHVVACAAEGGLAPDEKFIGAALDGTGLGDDGTIWGGEILLASFKGYQRLFHLLPFPLPGGDRAVEEPYRVALSLLQTGGFHPPTSWMERITPQEMEILSTMITKGLNSPLTSSMGRLFDGVASLLGVKDRCSYEAQGAILLEEMVTPEEKESYPHTLKGGIMDWRPILQGLLEDLMAGQGADKMATRFHNAVANMITEAVSEASRAWGVQKVVLSGGVFQNRVLLKGLLERLQEIKLTPILHRQVPPNDGGLSLGQAVIGAMNLLED